MSSPKRPTPDVALDACVLINLVASEIGLGHLAKVIGVALHVTGVVASEAQYLLPMEEGGERELIDVEGLIRAGELREIEMSSTEVASYVELAKDLDDGEASTAAVAVSRGWTVASDDRKARRFASTMGAELIGTSELLKRWADGLPSDPAEVGKTLARIQTRARFVPPHHDPLRTWWRGATPS